MSAYPIIFFGTSDFAVRQLEALIHDDAFSVVAIVTKPDQPVGRSRKLTPPPVKVLGESHGIPVHQYATLKRNKDIVDLLTSSQIPVCIVVDYGLLLPDELLDIPTKGFVNIHPSALPQYRGPSPIQAALANGDTKTAVSIMLVDAEMDHGPVLAQKGVPISGDAYYSDLRALLAEESADLLLQTLPLYLSGDIIPEEQNHAAATFCKIITKDDARIEWSDSAEAIYNKVRAYASWPIAWTMSAGKRYKVHRAAVSETSLSAANPGEIIADQLSLYVQTGDGILEIKEIQAEGKQKMPASTFLKGSRLTKFE